MSAHYFLVAVIADKVVGFTSLRDDGYLDYMFTHHDHQGLGIATMLLLNLEARAREIQLKEIFVDVSITARPFFLHHGYTIRERNIKIIKDVSFENAVMQKALS
ncbi:MAG: GCN5-related N-acetyltransferase [Bacteroidetes bacterium]|nr:GCN5-related N-acetyltransferase [Bacteroidota bacterium]